VRPVRSSCPARAFSLHDTAGKSHKEAMRCLKRRLADIVYRTMVKDSVSSLTAAA
jgi:transposase